MASIERFKRPFCPVFRTSASRFSSNALFPLGSFFERHIIGALERFLSRARTFRMAISLREISTSAWPGCELPISVCKSFLY